MAAEVFRRGMLGDSDLEGDRPKACDQARLASSTKTRTPLRGLRPVGPTHRAGDAFVPFPFLADFSFPGLPSVPIQDFLVS